MSYVYTTKGQLLAAASDAPQRREDRAEYIRAVIASGIADAYRAPVFTGGFDSYACMGDSIETYYNGFRIVAHIEHDQDKSIDDDDCHSVQNALDYTDEQHAQLMEARAAYIRSEWHYCGVVLSVSRNGVMLDGHAASLWGIECNYPGGDNSYLTVVACELLPEALKAAQAALDSPAALIDVLRALVCAADELTDGQIDPSNGSAEREFIAALEAARAALEQ